VGGPSWVASIVNTLGNNPRCTNGEIYWKNTAIILTWDDWGGWYDHELPTILPLPQGDYQNGFRVPLIFVSAYTQPGLIDNQRHDFGSVLRFIEHNFGITEGALNFADARAATDLTSFYHLNRLPRHFVTITAPKGAEYFIHDKTPLTDPDDD
jgi:phospholipase C